MIKGLIAPILSPFNDDLSFNQDLYNALAAELLQTGCSGLAPFGTTGEALSVGRRPAFTLCGQAAPCRRVNEIGR